MAKTPEELTMLPDGWDSYKGVPVTLANCNMANVVADALYHHVDIKPQFIPGSDGSIQIEYHGRIKGVKVDIEIMIECNDNKPTDARIG